MNQHKYSLLPFKWTGIFLALVAFSANVRAQIPDYFEQGQMWAYYSSVTGPDGCAFYSENVLYVDGDTLIQGASYKRIGQRGSYTQQNAGPPPWDCDEQVYYYDETFCYIAQAGDSILVHDHPSFPNGLMFSYDLNIGDTITVAWSSWVVQSIDTIVLNNSPHRRFYTDAQQQEYLIEGVVQAAGFGTYPLLYQFVQGGLGPLEMTCFAENGSTVWSNPLFQPAGCYYFTDLGVDEEASRSFHPVIYPNPVATLLNVVVPVPMSYSVILFNVLGEQVLFKLNPKAIDLSGLSNGTYFALIKDRGTGRSARKKVIVAH